uniref:Cerebellin 18 n=1 Tax=Kryptolebias marmoratus TaxID=37003 RepID=A0A3Q3BIM6_KRYMA
LQTLTLSLSFLCLVAVMWQGALTCDKWDCNCTFSRVRSCCCAADDMYQLEEESFLRIKVLWSNMVTLKNRAKDLAIPVPGSTLRCFGPFSINVPIPFSNVTLNTGGGYKPSMGVFTALFPGIYVFSYTVYSSVDVDGHLYHKVQLMKNGEKGVSVWENNREDAEDSATQVVALELQQGDQVYLELSSGQKLCTHLDYNIFTGYIVYPYTD